MVRETAACGALLQNYPLEELKKRSPLFEKDVYDIFSAEHSLQLRDIFGGTGSGAVRAQIKELRASCSAGGR
jgi:argininosuccinate lyase